MIFCPYNFHYFQKQIQKFCRGVEEGGCNENYRHENYADIRFQHLFRHKNKHTTLSLLRFLFWVIFFALFDYFSLFSEIPPHTLCSVVVVLHDKMSFITH